MHTRPLIPTTAALLIATGLAHAGEQDFLSTGHHLDMARAFALATTQPDGTPATVDPAAAGATSPAAPVEGEGAGGGGGDNDLAKKLQNPVADLISVPLQFNYDERFGPKDAGKVTLNVQPVIPFKLNEHWNLITRTIVPIINFDSPATGVDSAFGLGDILATQFFSPRKQGPYGVIIGLGPAWLLPTATDDLLGSEQLAIGPSIVALKQSSGWTYGILANHLWTVAGNDDRSEVNATFLQPFVSYTWPTATTLGLNTESTYDWTSSQWTVPINLFGSQLLKVGSHPISLTLGGRYYADSPDGGPEWGVRFVVTFLFPK